MSNKDNKEYLVMELDSNLTYTIVEAICDEARLNYEILYKSPYTDMTINYEPSDITGWIKVYEIEYDITNNTHQFYINLICKIDNIINKFNEQLLYTSPESFYDLEGVDDNAQD